KRPRSATLLTWADHGILDFSLIISPSTANRPCPRWWMVFGSFCAGSVQALSTSRTKRLYLLTRRVGKYSCEYCVFVAQFRIPVALDGCYDPFLARILRWPMTYL